MDIPLAERVALVIGASSGIGEATALTLANAGIKVAVAARRTERIEALVAQIQKNGGEALALSGDIAEEAFAKDTVAQTVRHYGRIDILINSAGVIQGGSVEGADTNSWHQVMDVNFFAALYTCTAVIPHMRKQGSGDIINVSSTAGRRAPGAFGCYGASKHALNGMSKGLRQEVGGHGIRVCILEPGATTTEISEKITAPGIRKFMRAHIGKEGAMKPEDISAVILSIISLPSRATVDEILIRPTIDTTAI